MNDVVNSKYLQLELTELTSSTHATKSNDLLDEDEDSVLTSSSVDEHTNKYQSQQLKKSLTFIDGLGIIIGIVIGSGVFSSPGVTLTRAGSPINAMLAWLTAGILVFLASQCYMELGRMFPSSGGDYEYLKQTYGDVVAFTFTWFYFWISKSGSQAIIGTIFGRYFTSLLELISNRSLNIGYYGNESITTKLFAIVCIIILTINNCRSVKESATVQNVFATLKVLLIIILLLISVIYVIFVEHETLQVNMSSKAPLSLSSLVFSLIPCLWSFDGWGDLNFMQEELKDPANDFHRVITFGIMIITVCFLLANLSYFAVLQSEQILSTATIAETVGLSMDETFSTQRLFSIIFSLGVAVSTVGSMNGSIMTGGRIFFAAARDGNAFAIINQLNAQGSPFVAVIMQGLWSVFLLILPGSDFAALLDYFGPLSWFYYALTCSCVVIQRYQNPNAVRPYKCLFYPISPVVVIAVSIYIIITSLIQEFRYTMGAVACVLFSIPVYYAFFRKQNNS